MASDTEVVVETPGGTFSPQGEGEYRTDLLEDGRTVQFVVYSGIATVSTEWGSVLVGAGQRTIASEGAAPAPPEEYLGNDNFFAWTEDRQRRFVTTAETHYEELPEEVREYAQDLDGHGRWQQDVHLGWVWYPAVSNGWAPYQLGRWAHTPFGLTWVSSDPWGWAPYHYGRWGHGRLGWYWLPGSVWGPGLGVLELRARLGRLVSVGLLRLPGVQLLRMGSPLRRGSRLWVWDRESAAEPSLGKRCPGARSPVEPVGALPAATPSAVPPPANGCPPPVCGTRETLRFCPGEPSWTGVSGSARWGSLR